MSEKQLIPSPTGMSLSDIYYVLFRHKWKIASISAIGVIIALLLPTLWPLPYQSEAKLFIRYVLENRSPGQVGADSKPRSSEERGGNVIDTELEILTSMDLAQEVANVIGPEKILAKAGGGTDAQNAAALIRNNLVTSVPGKGNVIRLVFQHPDSAIVQPVLSQIIDTYLLKHAEIHRSVGVFDDFLRQETEVLRNRLVDTEQKLRTAKTNAQVISLEDTKSTFSEQMSRIQQAIFDAEAELGEHQAAVAEMGRLLHTKSASATNSVAATNEVAVPSGKLNEYKRVCTRLVSLGNREQDLLTQFTPENTRVKEVREQIDEAEKLKQTLEEENPGLLAVKAAEPKAADPAYGSRLDPVVEMTRSAALDAKIKVLMGQLDKIRKQATVVDEMEGSITELQRQKELQEAHYKHFLTTLELSRIDQTFAAGHVSNINKIQAPSPPSRDSAKLEKVRAMILFGSIAAAIALAFLIELYLDRSVKRPFEIEARLGVPLFLTIPRVSRNGKPPVLTAARKVPLLPQKTHDGQEESGASTPLGASTEQRDRPLTTHQSEIVPWDSRHPLRPFYETLRDRLINYFEIKGLKHKPKLVAVTSCAGGAGVSTTAAGLAACLSETGDGSVLLVDMNLEQGAAHHFHKGNLDCSLDEILENGKRETALVQDNLYIVTESTDGDKLPRVLPKRFSQLIPKLKASDYDYIIFDMPAVSQISVTPRLARFMDMVLVVIESEKTDRDTVKHATALLAESKATVSVVLNKTRSYLPGWLHREL